MRAIFLHFTEKPKKDMLPDWESDTGEEMKKKGKVYLASMGIYIFTRKMLFDLLQSEYKEGTILVRRSFLNLFKNIKSPVTNTTATGQISGISILSLRPISISQLIYLNSIYLIIAKAIYTRARMLPPAKISGTPWKRH
jgi:glucose-1-phosphate adenylyltransferase